MCRKLLWGKELRRKSRAGKKSACVCRGGAGDLRSGIRRGRRPARNSETGDRRQVTGEIGGDMRSELPTLRWAAGVRGAAGKVCLTGSAGC